MAGLNKAFDGFMIFQLAGSLTDKPASQHDADIIVYPKFPFDMKAFSKGLHGQWDADSCRGHDIYHAISGQA